MCQVTIPLSHNTHLRPNVQGRLLFGNDLPDMKKNLVGGISYGKFLPHQQPLAGMGHAEFFESKFVSASLRVQQRIKGRHYLLFDGCMAAQNEDIKHLFDNKLMWGVQAAYFYNSSILGPMGATLGWNSHTKRVNFFVSLGFEF